MNPHSLQTRNFKIFSSSFPSSPKRKKSVPPQSPPTTEATPSLPAQSVNAPVFVPKSSTPILSAATPSVQSVESPASGSNLTSPSRSNVHTGWTNPAEYDEGEDPFDPFSNYQYGNGYENGVDSVTQRLQTLGANGYDDPHGQHPFLPSEYPSPSIDYYQSASTFIPQPLNYHLYSNPIPEAFTHNYFISDAIREELQKRSETIHTAPVPGLGLPEELQGYHTLVPLEATAGDRRKLGNWYSSVYRAVNSTDGVTYALRRVEGYRLMNPAAFGPVEAWSRLKHPNVVQVREAFTSQAFNDNSLVVVYDYHPNAETLFNLHLKPKPPTLQNGRLQQSRDGSLVPERTLWSYIVQLASAIQAIHDAGLVVRVMDSTKILVTSKNRVRISSCCLIDILTYDARQSQDISLMQQEDLAYFGKLVFELCCGQVNAMANLAKALQTIDKNYSQDVKNVAMYLVKPSPHKSIRQLLDTMGSRVLLEMRETQNAVDRLEAELMSELENGRLVRLLTKMGFINERPEFGRSHRWSETGDRYIIKLFRDHVFHQVDENLDPVVNLTHVLTCLNKLDVGSDERMMLMARDEQSCLVVSYKDVKTCIESAYSELAKKPSVR
ncbi:hypothetical protein BDM02DRAFT_3113348 [Thelephora ganbajun]|uniref:Uncharacterized protein n=1 Tax=Thelephora ganbajun TaxID=370292 RepID=A0ACB6ZJT0_THEGA|nr:hypothetical protein BDM02DRAFT_3113348 [Thelephora ganbajun]